MDLSLVNRCECRVETLRVTLAPTFVDNTYGSNTIGRLGDDHTFDHLKGADKPQIALHDNNGDVQFGSMH